MRTTLILVSLVSKNAKPQYMLYQTVFSDTKLNLVIYLSSKNTSTTAKVKPTLWAMTKKILRAKRARFDSYKIMFCVYWQATADSAGFGWWGAWGPGAVGGPMCGYRIFM